LVSIADGEIKARRLSRSGASDLVRARARARARKIIHNHRQEQTLNYIKTRKDLSFGLAPLLIFIGIFIFCQFSNLIHYYFDGLWIATGCAFLLVITPLGNRRLAHNTSDITTRLPIPQWLFCIVLFELSLFGVFWGICYVAGIAFPINTTSHPYLFSQSLQTELLQYGLFPWSQYAVITVGMGILAYRQQHNAYFSNLFRPLIKTNIQSTLSLITNVGARRATMFGIGLTLLFLPILMVSLLLPPEKHIAHGFQIVALFVTLLLFFSTFSDTVKAYLMRLFSRHIPTFLSLPVFCLILALILVVSSAMIAGITPKSDQSTPLFIQNWIDYHWQTAWMIFSITWWITLTPTICAYLVRISRGYRIRDVILVMMILPITSAVFLLYPHNLSLPVPETTIKILALLSFLIALPLLINYRNLPCLISAYFPKNGEIKTRDHYSFFQKTIQLCIIGFYFYLVIGINGISILIFAANYFWLVSVLAACIAVVKNSYSK